MGLAESKLRLVMVRVCTRVCTRVRARVCTRTRQLHTRVRQRRARVMYLINGRFLSHWRVSAGVLVELLTLRRRVLTVSRPRLIRRRLKIGHVVPHLGHFAALVGPSAHCYSGGFSAHVLFRRRIRAGVYIIAYRFIHERLAAVLHVKDITRGL